MTWSFSRLPTSVILNIVWNLSLPFDVVRDRIFHLFTKLQRLKCGLKWNLNRTMTPCSFYGRALTKLSNISNWPLQCAPWLRHSGQWTSLCTDQAGHQMTSVCLASSDLLVSRKITNSPLTPRFLAEARCDILAAVLQVRRHCRTHTYYVRPWWWLNVYVQCAMHRVKPQNQPKKPQINEFYADYELTHVWRSNWRSNRLQNKNFYNVDTGHWSIAKLCQVRDISNSRSVWFVDLFSDITQSWKILLWSIVGAAAGFSDAWMLV